MIIDGFEVAVMMIDWLLFHCVGVFSYVFLLVLWVWKFWFPLGVIRLSVFMSFHRTFNPN